ncbi:MAG: Thiol peroxidase, Bcp-type [Labilithrix sp.]|nr:Thiol peroxidase, Bcp-type [Labilithrix sp.]
MRSVLVAASLSLLALTSAACGRDAPRAEPAPATSTTTTSSTAAEVKVGMPAPDFTAKAHDGTDVQLSKLKGKPVVVYFYPKDETPGCTTEAQNFRDSWKDLSASGVVVIGVSTDDLDAHKAFAKNHDLPFLLVSDASGSIAKTFGVPSRGGHLARQTIVIGADGNVKKIYRDVDPGKHAAEVLADGKS